MKMLSTTEAAEQLSVSPIRVRQLIQEGRLTAQKIGRDYVILESDLEPIRVRKPGRPSKKKE